MDPVLINLGCTKEHSRQSVEEFKEDREALECGRDSTTSKLAEIEGDDGVINLTSVVFADETANMGANNENIPKIEAQLPRNSAIMPDVTRTLENRS
jgi:hypothetical protein